MNQLGTAPLSCMHTDETLLTRSTMRKTLASIIVFVSLSMAACGDEPAPAPEPYVESAAPSESVPATEVDYNQDISDVTATPDKDTRNGVRLTFTITNHGTEASYYDVVLGIYDKDAAQVGAVRVNTEASARGATQPGGVLKISDVYIADIVLPPTFSVRVQTVDRFPES